MHYINNFVFLLKDFYFRCFISLYILAYSIYLPFNNCSVFICLLNFQTITPPPSHFGSIQMLKLLQSCLKKHSVGVECVGVRGFVWINVVCLVWDKVNGVANVFNTLHK